MALWKLYDMPSIPLTIPVRRLRTDFYHTRDKLMKAKRALVRRIEDQHQIVAEAKGKIREMEKHLAYVEGAYKDTNDLYIYTDFQSEQAIESGAKNEFEPQKEVNIA